VSGVVSREDTCVLAFDQATCLVRFQSVCEEDVVPHLNIVAVMRRHDACGLEA
jgi:hypothetical protein